MSENSLDVKLIVRGPNTELDKFKSKTEELPAMLFLHQRFINVDMYDVPENVTVKGLLHYLGNVNLAAEVLINEEIQLIVRRAA